MHIRRAALTDLERVVNLLFAMLEELQASGDPAARLDPLAFSWLSGRVRVNLQNDEHFYGLAVPDETGAVGVIEAGLVQPHPVYAPRQALHVYSLYVAPPHRRQGVAGALLAEAAAWGRAHGCALVELNVQAGNPARHFYEKHGFSVFELRLQKPL